MRLNRLITRFFALAFEFCALHVRSICARSIRAPAPSASAATAHPARTKQSERQHPESEHRQEAEKAAGHQQDRERNPGVARRRLAQPATNFAGRGGSFFSNQAKCRSSSFWCSLNEPLLLERRCSLDAAARASVCRGRGLETRRRQVAGAAALPFLGLARLGTHGLARGRRPDDGRPPGRSGRGLAWLGTGSERRAASRRELGLPTAFANDRP